MPLIGGVNVPDDATEADLSGLGLSAFPTDILTVTTLQSLNLSNNNIPSLPTNLGVLTKLEDFCISNNQISTVPPELAPLGDQLRDFDISDNPITTLSTDVQKLLHTNMRNPQIYLQRTVTVTNVPAGATAVVCIVKW